MRSLIVTVILCSIMILAATTNFIYVNNLADAMIEIVDTLPDINEPMCVEKVNELYQKWTKHSPIIGLTVGFTTVDKLSEHCQTLLSCAKVGDVYGYYSTLTLLYDAIDDIRRLEQFSVSNLF